MAGSTSPAFVTLVALSLLSVPFVGCLGDSAERLAEGQALDRGANETVRHLEGEGSMAIPFVLNGSNASFTLFYRLDGRENQEGMALSVINRTSWLSGTVFGPEIEEEKRILDTTTRASRAEAASTVHRANDSAGWVRAQVWNVSSRFWNETMLLGGVAGTADGSRPFDVWINGTDVRLLSQPSRGEGWIVPPSEWSVGARVVEDLPDPLGAAQVGLDMRANWSVEEGALINDPVFANSNLKERSLHNENHTWDSRYGRSSYSSEVFWPLFLASEAQTWSLEVHRRVATDELETNHLWLGDVEIPDVFLESGTTLPPPEGRPVTQ